MVGAGYKWRGGRLRTGARGNAKLSVRAYSRRGFCAGPAVAADLPTKKAAPAPVPEPVLPSTWRFEITGYGWATSLAGSTGFGSLPTLPYYAQLRQSARALPGRHHE